MRRTTVVFPDPAPPATPITNELIRSIIPTVSLGTSLPIFGRAEVCRSRLIWAAVGITVTTASVVTVLPPNLSRYAAVGSLFLKYGRTSDPDPADADNLARDLESLGPTFVKLGPV